MTSALCRTYCGSNNTSRYATGNDTQYAITRAHIADGD